MKILKIILIFIGSFALMYLLGAFYCVDFNFKNWSSGTRFITELLALGMAGMSVSALIVFDNND